jgi:hypothetical protein
MPRKQRDWPRKLQNEANRRKGLFTTERRAERRGLTKRAKKIALDQAIVKVGGSFVRAASDC